MIKSNKPKNSFRLPRISMLLDSDQFTLAEPQTHMNCTKIRNYLKNTFCKQNNNPKDLKGNTICLQFPIRKKKLPVDLVQQLKIQKLSDSGIFVNRAACSNIRNNVRAKMYKYDQERNQIMTQRVGNNTSEVQNFVLRQLIGKQAKKCLQNKKYETFQQQFKPKQRLVAVRKYEVLQKVTRWENNDNQNLQKQCDDTILEQFVQNSKRTRLI